MKTHISFLLVLLLSIVSVGFGAHFTPVQEMTYCNSDALSRLLPSYDPNELTDWQNESAPNYNGSVSYTLFGPAPDGGYISSYAETFIEYYIEMGDEEFPENVLYMSSYSNTSVQISSDYGVEAYAWGGATAVDPNVAVGNYYRIDPDAGESNGDIVTISFDFLADLYSYSEGGSSNSVRVDGGFAGSDVMISRNYTDLNDVSTGEIIYSLPTINADGYYPDSATLTVEVGDVIGIHCDVYSNAYTGMNPGSADSTASVEMLLEITEVTAKPYTAADADIDGSGRVDLGDFAILAQFWLEDVPLATNDGSTCAKAIEINGFGTVQGSNVGALISPVTYCGGDNDGNAVWYKFTSPGDMFVRFAVNPDFDATLALYDTCGSAAFDCADGYPDEEIYYGMDPGETVYIRVGGYDMEEGDFELTVEQAFPA